MADALPTTSGSLSHAYVDGSFVAMCGYVRGAREPMNASKPRCPECANREEETKPVPDHFERVWVEGVRVGDEVQAVPYGPKGKVIDADRMGWTLVQYAPGAVVSYKHGMDRLSVVSAASDETQPTPEGT